MTLPLHSPFIDKLIHLALEEDIAHGDLTSHATCPREISVISKIIARENLTMCGGALIERIKTLGNFDFKVELKSKDGDNCESNQELARLVGCGRDILTAERTILNFLQRLSGIATFTKKIVQQATPILVLDTRKTIPGWRVLDKYAVGIGGGSNHRISLSDMILIKNNHIDLWKGDFEALLANVRKEKPRYTPIQIEVRDMEELKRALTGNPSSIMLDNFQDTTIKEALEYLKSAAPHVLVEVSGGITSARIASLKTMGVPAVSMGALTNAPHHCDISLRIIND